MDDLGRLVLLSGIVSEDLAVVPYGCVAIRLDVGGEARPQAFTLFRPGEVGAWRNTQVYEYAY